MADASAREVATWSAAQQAMLEVAMRRHGPSTECRWDRIAEDVAGMSTNDCLERYKRLCHAVREKQHAATRWPFVVVTVPHKGFGCRALRNIVRGERLIAERPLITRGPDSRPLAELVAALSGRDRAAFFSLSQNAARFGEAKTAEGVFATNALPNHDFAQEFEAVFAVVSRFNHACDANACFRWNRTLGMMTVHATRNIRPNEEVTINYGFPSGCVLRDQRRARLRQSFGFECACQQCTLSGEQLQRSEQLCAAIGDTTSLISELCVWGSLPTLVCVEATSVLRRLEARHALIREHSSRGHRRGVDAFFRCAVEFCEAAAARLLELVHSAPAGVDALRMLEMAVPLAALHAAAIAYMRAARSWAEHARAATRDLGGEDSLAYMLWKAALDNGFWTAEGDGIDPESIGRLNFARAWVDAGLGAPGPRVADVISGRLERGACDDLSDHPPGEVEVLGKACSSASLEWTVVGDSIRGQPLGDW